MSVPRTTSGHRRRASAAGLLGVVTLGAVALLGGTGAWTSAAAAPGASSGGDAGNRGGTRAVTHSVTHSVTLEQTAALADNPLKGFLPFAPEPGQTLDAADPSFPHTLEWFYLPVDAVVTGEDTYDWTRVEAYLSSIAARGHQSVLRFYLDYPGRDSGVPAYLLGEGGISQERRYDFWDNNGVSFSPDYDDPRVVGLITGFIDALGERYDGDPRIAYLTAGLVGFWGEDHTYPMNGLVEPTNPEGIDWMPSAATRATIWDAWDAALDETWLQARYPTADVAAHAFGLHDDSFAYATLPTTDWHFLAQVQAAGMTEAWRTAPIGGELYPPLQTCIFSEPLDCPNAAEEIAAGRDYDVAGSTAASHASWIINHQAWATGYDGDDRERAVAAAAALGYDLAATQATLTNNGGGASVTLTLTNRGVAPFYGDWPAELVVLDDEGEVVRRTAVDADLPSIQPGASATVEASLDGGGRNLAGATVAFHVPNVMTGGEPLRFANTTQDQDAPGYLTLGEVPGLS
ncbi:DUF4832 domain-containing protein [Promicromonospora sp. NPDC050249]|uniref:DUF4832 domain-containing protein n=1 Tax=Promicromonospora sp. NPDC050249 TaxID=3154743 RepID=UPI0033EE305E